jgi:hypothetical protein
MVVRKFKLREDDKVLFCFSEEMMETWIFWLSFFQ